MNVSSGPYHPGEIEIQRRAGVREEATSVGRILSGTIPPAVAAILPSFRMAVAASIDARGRAWASLLTAGAGFIQPVGETHLRLDARPGPGDPLGANLAARAPLGLLAIDPATRRRLRFNGQGLLTDDLGLVMAVRQAYGNCRKYIQSRRILTTRDDGTARTRDRGTAPTRSAGRLDARLRDLVSSSDTFFIASHHPEGGADASHRGGRPGFVQVESATRLSFPDYPGNNMFNTLGNLAIDPTAGLLFIDFESGDLLQATGRATLEWGGPGSSRGAGVARVVVDIEDTIVTLGGCPLRFSPAEPWAGNP